MFEEFGYVIKDQVEVNGKHDGGKEAKHLRDTVDRVDGTQHRHRVPGPGGTGPGGTGTLPPPASWPVSDLWGQAAQSAGTDPCEQREVGRWAVRVV